MTKILNTDGLVTVTDLLRQREKEHQKLISSLPDQILFQFNELSFNSKLADYKTACQNRNVIIKKYAFIFPNFEEFSHEKFEHEIIPLLTTTDKISDVLKLLWLDHEGAGFNLNVKGKDILLKASAAPNIINQFNMDYPKEIDELAEAIIAAKWTMIFPEGIDPQFTNGEYIVNNLTFNQIKESCCTYFTKQQLEEYLFAHSAAQVFNGLHQRGIGFNTKPDFPRGLLDIIEPGIKHGGIATQYNNYKPAQHLLKGISNEKKSNVRIL